MVNLCLKSCTFFASILPIIFCGVKPELIFLVTVFSLFGFGPKKDCELQYIYLIIFSVQSPRGHSLEGGVLEITLFHI